MIYQLNDNEGSLWATIETDAREDIVRMVWKQANNQDDEDGDPFDVFLEKMEELNTNTDRIWITEINP